MLEIWPTILPHLGHHHILILFVITGLDTMLHHDCQWNEPVMGNSGAVANVMKSTSPSRRRGWRSTDVQRSTNTSSGAWNGSGDDACNPSRRCLVAYKYAGPDGLVRAHEGTRGVLGCRPKS
jgi:hypothetical protein